MVQDEDAKKSDSEDEEGDPKKKKKAKPAKSDSRMLAFTDSLNSAEYEKLVEFFAKEVPSLVIKVSNIGVKAFAQK